MWNVLKAAGWKWLDKCCNGYSVINVVVVVGFYHTIKTVTSLTMYFNFEHSTNRIIFDQLTFLKCVFHCTCIPFYDSDTFRFGFIFKLMTIFPANDIFQLQSNHKNTWHNSIYSFNSTPPCHRLTNQFIIVVSFFVKQNISMRFSHCNIQANKKKKK